MWSVKVLHLAVKRTSPGSARTAARGVRGVKKREPGASLSVMVGGNDEPRCQQVVPMLRGTESCGGCCIASPTEKNEAFDLKERGR